MCDRKTWSILSRREAQSDLCFKNNIKKIMPAKSLNVESKDAKGKPIMGLLEDSR